MKRNINPIPLSGQRCQTFPLNFFRDVRLILSDNGWKNFQRRALLSSRGLQPDYTTFQSSPQSSLATRPIKRKLFSSPLVRSAMLASNVFYLIRFNRVLEKKYSIICYYKPRETTLYRPIFFLSRETINNEL